MLFAVVVANTTDKNKPNATTPQPKCSSHGSSVADFETKRILGQVVVGYFREIIAPGAGEFIPDLQVFPRRTHIVSRR